MAIDGHPPPPPQLMTTSPDGGSSGKEKASTSSRDGTQMERYRREKMTDLYTVLQSLVPNLFPKATKTKIIDETIAYIKHLENVIIALEAQKAAMTTIVSSTIRAQGVVEVAVKGNATFFTLRLPSRPRLPLLVVELFDKHNAQVLATTIACNNGILSMTVTSVTLDEETVEKIKGELVNI